ERNEHADDVFLPSCDQRNDRGAGPHTQHSPNRVDEVQVGGLTYDDEIGLLERGNARELTPGVRLGDDVEPLRAEDRGHAEAGELELVTDDRALLISCV